MFALCVHCFSPALLKTFFARAMNLSIFLRYSFFCARCTWQDFFEREEQQADRRKIHCLELNELMLLQVIYCKFAFPSTQLSTTPIQIKLICCEMARIPYQRHHFTLRLLAYTSVKMVFLFSLNIECLSINIFCSSFVHSLKIILSCFHFNLAHLLLFHSEIICAIFFSHARTKRYVPNVNRFCDNTVLQVQPQPIFR